MKKFVSLILFQNVHRGDWSGSHIWLVRWRRSCTSALSPTGYSTATFVPPTPKEEEKVKVISKKNYSSFYDNHASCNMYSAETLSIPKDPGDENRVYGYVDLQSDITLQQSLAYQSSKDLCVNTVPNVCYGQLRSTS